MSARLPCESRAQWFRCPCSARESSSPKRSRISSSSRDCAADPSCTNQRLAYSSDVWPISQKSRTDSISLRRSNRVRRLHASASAAAPSSAPPYSSRASRMPASAWALY
eukprot:scaffold24680_cov221-Isochrysis_galbana.AAC.3